VRALLDADKFDLVEKPSKQLQDLFVDPWQKSAGNRPHGLPPYLIVIYALDEVNDGGGFTFLQALLTSLCNCFPPEVVCRLHKVTEEDVGADNLRYLDAELPLWTQN
jgi:hypothetical protein